MTGLAWREIPSFHTEKYYALVSHSQSREIIPHSFFMIKLAQYKNQNNYEIENASYSSIQKDRLSIPKTESPQQRAFSSCINDGIQRYKLINNADSCDTKPANLFLSMLESLSYIAIPRITFYTDAVKARITFYQREFFIDYDYEEPESVFISTFEGDKLLVKDGPVKSLLQILESF